MMTKSEAGRELEEIGKDLVDMTIKSMDLMVMTLMELHATVIAHGFIDDQVAMLLHRGRKAHREIRESGQRLLSPSEYAVRMKETIDGIELLIAEMEGLPRVH
jgi:hypothetical protein